MSYIPKTVILGGYKISPEAWAFAWKKYEDNPNLPYVIEDYFCDADPLHSEGPYFIGLPIFEIDDHDSGVFRFDDIIANAETIYKTKALFSFLLNDYYTIHPEEKIPVWDKYIFMTWT